MGFVGVTGSGKTTAIDLILGMLEPQEGQLSVDGQPINAANRRQWQRAIGYVPQRVYLRMTAWLQTLHLVYRIMILINKLWARRQNC